MTPAFERVIKFDLEAHNFQWYLATDQLYDEFIDAHTHTTEKNLNRITRQTKNAQPLEIKTLKSFDLPILLFCSIRMGERAGRRGHESTSHKTQ